MAIVGALIELSGGNVRNHHFYLREAAFLLPSSAIGGANADEVAEEELIVDFHPGSSVKTDIAGDKMILRKRAPVREFFELAGLVEGDRIIFEKTGRLTFRVSKLMR